MFAYKNFGLILVVEDSLDYRIITSVVVHFKLNHYTQAYYISLQV